LLTIRHCFPLDFPPTTRHYVLPQFASALR
jgi:hypothetical protein